MYVAGGKPPVKLLKALSVISAYLHPAFERQGWIKPGHSKRSCVLCSLAVRDFLRRIGYGHATVRPVYLVVHARDAEGKAIHSLGVGDHTALPDGNQHITDTPLDWSGHMVVTLGSWLIDTTVYQTIRPQWAELPGMMAVPLDRQDNMISAWGMKSIAGVVAKRGDDIVEAIWFDQPYNTRWRTGGDAKIERRSAVVKELVHRFKMSYWGEKKPA